jgi:hypothetical protein
MKRENENDQWSEDMQLIQKKTQKTPKSEIAKARRIMDDYFKIKEDLHNG